MNRWFNFVGSSVVIACKWIITWSATIAAIYGVLSKAYDLPYEDTIVTAGAVIASIAIIIVGAAKPDVEFQNGSRMSGMEILADQIKIDTDDESEKSPRE